MHTLTAETTADRDGVDLGDLHTEDLFDSLGDFHLGGILGDFEGVPFLGDTGQGLLRDRDDHSGKADGCLYAADEGTMEECH